MSLLPAKILLATDGSQEAVLAAQTAVDISGKTSSELHVVHVGRLLGYVGYPGPDMRVLPGAQEELDKEARRLLEAQMEQIQSRQRHSNASASQIGKTGRRYHRRG